MQFHELPSFSIYTDVFKDCKTIADTVYINYVRTQDDISNGIYIPVAQLSEDVGISAYHIHKSNTRFNKLPQFSVNRSFYKSRYRQPHWSGHSYIYYPAFTIALKSLSAGILLSFMHNPPLSSFTDKWIMERTMLTCKQLYTAKLKLRQARLITTKIEKCCSYTVCTKQLYKLLGCTEYSSISISNCYYYTAYIFSNQHYKLIRFFGGFFKSISLHRCNSYNRL